MANELKMAKFKAILALWEQGWSCRRICRELGVPRETVSRYLRMARARTGQPAHPLQPPLSDRSGPSSVCEPRRPLRRLVAGQASGQIPASAQPHRRSPILAAGGSLLGADCHRLWGMLADRLDASRALLTPLARR